MVFDLHAVDMGKTVRFHGAILFSLIPYTSMQRG